jgi:predicted nucleic acid-binding Zn ribbon protein
MNTTIPALRQWPQMPLFIYRCTNTGLRVQGFSADDVTTKEATTARARGSTYALGRDQDVS